MAAVTNFPSPTANPPPALTKDEKIDFIADRFCEIMTALGLDLTDYSLARTPYRIAEMYVNEIFSGLDQTNFPPLTFIENRYQHQGKSGMVFVKVNFHSFCEHHFVPMAGAAYIAYVPNEKLLGLSKIPRIVRFFAARPQVQERLTAQIADSLSIILETENVAVSLTAQHFCVMARGIEDTESHATTNVLRGDFNSSQSLQREFFEAINRIGRKTE